MYKTSISVTDRPVHWMHEYFRLINDFLSGHKTVVVWCLYFCREQTSVTSSQQLELVITGSHSPAALSLSISIVNISTRLKFFTWVNWQDFRNKSKQQCRSEWAKLACFMTEVLKYTLKMVAVLNKCLKFAHPGLEWGGSPVDDTKFETAETMWRHGLVTTGNRAAHCW